MADLYEEAKNLADRMGELKEELKRTEDEYNATLYKIRNEKILSEKYFLAEQVTKKVNPQFFRENIPDYYKAHAHVPHAQAVHIMSKLHGGEQEFQRFLYERSPGEFSRYATIAVSDVTRDFEDSMEQLKEAGAVKEEVRGYTVKPKLLFQIQQEQAVKDE